MTALTSKQQSFIDLMKTNDELTRRGFQLLLQRDDYIHFFGPLQEAGFFAPATNPAATVGERENTVRIPYWPPLDYLKALAQGAGERDDLPLAAEVMDVVRTVSTWRDEKGELRCNYHTNRTFAEILGLVPTNAVKLEDIDLIKEWLNDPYERMLVANALDKGALSRFLDSTSPENWKKAARVLHYVTAIGWHRGADESERRAITIVDDYWLNALIKHHARGIGAKTGEHAAGIMLARVRQVFSTPIGRNHSNVLRPAVEDDPQNRQLRAAENRMVEGARDVILGWADVDPDNARALIGRMLADDLQIIRRLGIYVLARHWTTMRDLYAGVVGPELFDDGHHHELYRLLQQRFSEMTPEEQTATIKAIEMLPKAIHGENPERLRRSRQYRWLSAINGKGSALADKWFSELDADPAVARLGDHPDFNSFITTSWVGPGATPYSPEELIALARANILVENLNAFSPSEEWHGPSSEGLRDALESAARTNPGVFFDSISLYIAAKPIYQHGVITGIKQAWEENNTLRWTQEWEALVGFFEQLLKAQDFWVQTHDIYKQWVVTSIADCLNAGTKTDEHAYDAALLPRTQAIIAFLLQHQPGVDAPDADAMTQALNTPKGRIVQALYTQALRAARVSDKQVGSHQKAWAAIRPLFEAELAKCKDANYEFSTLSGTYLPQLQYLDNAWTSKHVQEIFPPAHESNTLCALDGLAYASFTRPVYELLAEGGIIDRALKLELKGGREKLLQRIGAAYLWGVEELEGGRIALIFDRASAADLEVLAHLFWVVRNESLSPEQLERILAFWDRSIRWSQQQTQLPTLLISKMSLLAAHIKTLGDREQNLLELVAPYVHIGHSSDEFVAELLRLAPQNPEAITRTVKSMLAEHVPEYDYEDRLRSLLEFLAQHSQREAVILLCEQLRHLEGVQALFKSLTQH